MTREMNSDARYLKSLRPGYRRSLKFEPCPFCGNRRQRGRGRIGFDSYDGTIFVFCRECHASIGRQSYRAARAVWNRRQS